MQKNKIKLQLEIGFINGRSMSLQVFNKDSLIFDKSTFDKKKENVELELEFPTTLKIITDGKRVNDTIVSVDGVIVEDMFIKISKLSIDRMPIKTWILEKYLFSGKSQSGDTYDTNYIGYNGVTMIDLEFSNSFEFFLDALSRG